MNNAREQLDRLFTFDAIASLVFGTLALIAPHRAIAQIGGGEYDHSLHEALRLYGCLRLACGWILWHVREVDDGRFRKHVCEGLFVCYTLQALSVIRAQFTDKASTINWFAIVVLLMLSSTYGSFRFRKGGTLIKIYELPSASVLR